MFCGDRRRDQIIPAAGDQQAHATEAHSQQIAQEIGSHEQQAFALNRQIERHGGLPPYGNPFRNRAPQVIHETDAGGIPAGGLQLPAGQQQTGGDAAGFVGHHIQVHRLQRIIEANLNVQKLIIEGITLKPPALHHRRTHLVKAPAVAFLLVTTDPLKPLNVAVVNAVEDAQLITGVLIRLAVPNGPESNSMENWLSNKSMSLTLVM